MNPRKSASLANKTSSNAPGTLVTWACNRLSFIWAFLRDCWRLWSVSVSSVASFWSTCPISSWSEWKKTSLISSKCRRIWIESKNWLSRWVFLNFQSDKCFYCGEQKPKIKRVAANMTKIHVYFKSEFEMNVGSKNAKDLGFYKSQVYLAKSGNPESARPVPGSKGNFWSF